MRNPKQSAHPEQATQTPHDKPPGPHEQDRNAHTDPREQEQRVHNQPGNEKSRGRGTHQR